MFSSGDYILRRTVLWVWITNIFLLSALMIRIFLIPAMNAWWEPYADIRSDTFAGTTSPITFIPDWTKSENQEKSKRFEEINITEFIPTPEYNTTELLAPNTTKERTLLKYTYPVVYMGNYRFDYQEGNGGHPWVDIRAPLGTPVLSIANGVVIRVNQWDATGNRYVVIRHDNVPYNGTRWTLYSSYLHLSEIVVGEGMKIGKWEMLGRVGMTGIATTPHLHLQIDTADAPFHPYWHFTSEESRAAWYSFFWAIDSWLNRDLARKYTIHPLEFIQRYKNEIGDISFTSAPTEPIKESLSPKDAQDSGMVVAGYRSIEEDFCEKIRFTDVGKNTRLGRMLYPLIDQDCLFQEMRGTFGSKESATKRDAMIALMKLYRKLPSTWLSPFLDIPIWDTFQGYALTASRLGIISWNYAEPGKILTKEAFLDLAIQIGWISKNPSSIQIYSDITPLNPHYESIQSYWLLTRARGGKMNGSSILDRTTFVQILSELKKKK